MLKRIDTDSNSYKFISEMLGWVSYVGCGLATESIVIPWGYSFFKKKATRLAICMGALGIANYAGASAKIGFEDILYTYVDFYNSLPFVEKERVEEAPASDVKVEVVHPAGTEGYYVADPFDPTGNQVIRDASKAGLFHFDTEEDARDCFVKAMKLSKDFVTIQDLYQIRGMDIKIPDSALYGWTKGSFRKTEIGKMSEGYHMFVPLGTYCFCGVISNEEL